MAGFTYPVNGRKSNRAEYGEFNVNHSANSSGFAVGGSSALLALQPRLGILSERRVGLDPCHRLGAGLVGPSITRIRIALPVLSQRHRSEALAYFFAGGQSLS